MQNYNYLSKYNCIAFLVAQHSEIELFLKENAQFLSLVENSPFKIHVFASTSHSIFFVRTGIGKAAAASATQYAIDKLGAEIILNVGVVGSITKNLPISSGYLIERTKYLDVDMQIFGYPKGQMAKTSKEYYQPSEQLFANLGQLFPDFPSAIDFTCDSFVTFDNPFIKKDFHICELNNFAVADMELTAIGQVCDLNQIDFAAIKVISDEVLKLQEPIEQFDQYSENLAACNAVLKEVILKLLENFKS